MLRLENSLLCKQNGITSQIVYYHFEDRVLYFKGGSLVAARAPVIPKCRNWQCLEKLVQLSQL